MARVPDAAIMASRELTGRAMNLYIYYCMRRNHKTFECFVKLETIERDTGLKPAHASELKTQLIEKGWIVTKGRRIIPIKGFESEAATISDIPKISEYPKLKQPENAENFGYSEISFRNIRNESAETSDIPKTHHVHEPIKNIKPVIEPDTPGSATPSPRCPQCDGEPKVFWKNSYWQCGACGARGDVVKGALAYKPGSKDPKPLRPAARASPPQNSKAATVDLKFHPAILAVKNIIGEYPNHRVFKRIIEVLGEKFDHRRLEQCADAWALKTSNLHNLTWLFEWYRNGIPQGNGNGTGLQNNRGKDSGSRKATASESGTPANLGSATRLGTKRPGEA